MLRVALISFDPSISFLISIVMDLIGYLTISKTDRSFLNIVEEAEKEMEKDNEGISVAIIEDKAYWVVNNTFYQADVVDGQVDRDTSKPIDAFAMSAGDLAKMLYILDNLGEETL